MPLSIFYALIDPEEPLCTIKAKTLHCYKTSRPITGLILSELLSKMQISPSLAELMSGLNDGPRGIQDAFAEIEKCSAEKSSLLDLQQMGLTNEDLAEISPKLSDLAPHVRELNLFLNE